jgi:hypothetical protein
VIIQEPGFVPIRLRNTLWVFLIVLGGVAVPRLLRPDALVITRAMLASTIAEIWVDRDSVVVELEIGPGDIKAFRNLLPDELHQRLGYAPEPWIDRLLRFVDQDFVVRADDGPPSPGRLRSIEVRQRIQRDQVTGQALPNQPEDSETVVFARLAYPIPGRPSSVMIGPKVPEPGDAIASIGFVAYHGGLHVNDFRYLGRPERLALDWEDPWYSRFENRNLWRQYRSPVSAYLYIEPFEVRKEIVVRPRDLALWGLDLGLAGRDVIPVDEQEGIKRRVAEFLAERNPVTIDSEVADGFLDRIHFIYRNLRTSGVVQPPQDLDALSATLGVIWVYPVDGLPDEVEMTWEMFSDRIDRIPSAATDEAGSLPYFLSEGDNVLRWENFLTNPTVPGLVPVLDPPRRADLLALGATVLALLSLAWLARRYGGSLKTGPRPPARVIWMAVLTLVVLGLAVPAGLRAGRLSQEDTETILGGLLLNVYKAFDYREEEIIYDALARSASGDLLTDIYLETRRSLELANQGGARAKVKSVEVLDATNDPLDAGRGFRAVATWNVAGSVGHWGHVHQRVNQYEAELTVQVIDGAWRITDLEVLQEERLPAPYYPGSGTAVPPAGGM